METSEENLYNDAMMLGLKGLFKQKQGLWLCCLGLI